MAKLRIGCKVQYVVEGLELIKARGDMSQDELAEISPLLGSQQNISKIECQRVSHKIKPDVVEELATAFEIEFYGI